MTRFHIVPQNHSINADMQDDTGKYTDVAVDLNSRPYIHYYVTDRCLMHTKYVHAVVE